MGGDGGGVLSDESILIHSDESEGELFISPISLTVEGYWEISSADIIDGIFLFLFLRGLTEPFWGVEETDISGCEYTGLGEDGIVVSFVPML